MNLNNIKIGESLIVESISGNEKFLSRLRDFGVVNGAVLDKLYVGFCGAPIAVRVSGSVIALRRDDAVQITGQRIIHNG